jgi:hypothetical protein
VTRRGRFGGRHLRFRLRSSSAYPPTLGAVTLSHRRRLRTVACWLASTAGPQREPVTTQVTSSPPAWRGLATSRAP